MNREVQFLKKVIVSSSLLLFCFFNITNAQQDTTKKSGDLYEMDLESLMNIEVTVSSKKGMTQRESPGILTIITAEEISNSGARDLIDVLSLVPGVFFGVDVQGAVGIGIRGNWAHEGKVLLMIDGQELNEPLYATLLFGNHYSVDQIRRIELIRGPGSSIYGGNAELGVINIITKNAEDINGVEIGGIYGQLSDTYARRNASLMIGKKFNNFEFGFNAFAGQGNRSDREYTDIYGNSYDMSDNAVVNPMQLNTYVKYKNLQARFLYDDYEMTTRDAFDEVLMKAYKNSFKSLFGEIKYDYKVNEKLNLTAKYNFKQFKPWVMTETPVPGENEVYYTLYSDRVDIKNQGYIAASYDITENINLLAGGEYYYEKVAINDSLKLFFDSLTNINYHNTSGFIQALIKTKPFNITVGGRYENHSQFGNAFAPRIGITKVFNKFHFKALYSQAFRSPAIENINLNPEIKPERTEIIELEVGYMIGTKMFLTANVFDITMKDAIVYYTDSISELYTNYDNTGSRGFEIEYKYKDKWGYASLNYAFYTAENKNYVDIYAVDDGIFSNEKALLGAPQHKITLNGNIRVTRDFSVNPSVIYMSERYDISQIDSTGSPFITKYDPLVIANVFLYYCNPLKRELTVGVGVFNLLNSEFSYIQPYNSGHAPYPGQSREFTLKINYALNFSKK